MKGHRSSPTGKPAGRAQQIVIRADGRVAFGLLTQELFELALALAPGDPRLRTRRQAALNRQRKREGNEAASDRGD